MKYKELPPVEMLRELFDYNPVTGVVVRRKTTSPHSKKGAVVGCPQGPKGGQYLTVGIGYELFKLHRIIWKLMTGDDPVHFDVDHRDRNRTNNKWENLRVGSINTQHRPNSQNRGPNKGKRFKGVRQRANGSWFAGIQYQKKRIHLGYFQTEEEAALAYNAASRELHGEWGYQNPISPRSLHHQQESDE